MVRPPASNYVAVTERSSALTLGRAMKQRGVLRGTDISPGQALPVGGVERCELGDGLSGTAFLVDWRGDGGRDILYSLLPNMHRGGVYLYRQRRTDRAAVPVYEPPEPVAGVTGYHAMPLVTPEGGLHLLTFGNPTRDPAREPDPGWLKLYRNRAPRSSPRFAAPAERIAVDGRSLAEVFAAADLGTSTRTAARTASPTSLSPASTNTCWSTGRTRAAPTCATTPTWAPGAATAPTAPGWAASRPRGCSCCATPAAARSRCSVRRSHWRSTAPGTAAPTLRRSSVRIRLGDSRATPTRPASRQAPANQLSSTVLPLPRGPISATSCGGALPPSRSAMHCASTPCSFLRPVGYGCATDGCWPIAPLAVLLGRRASLDKDSFLC